MASGSRLQCMGLADVEAQAVKSCLKVASWFAPSCSFGVMYV